MGIQGKEQKSITKPTLHLPNRAASERSGAAKPLRLVSDHPTVRHRLPLRHPSFLHRRSLEPRQGAEQSGKMAVPPPGGGPGEEQQSPGRRAQTLVLCKPKWRGSGEMQALPATGSSSSAGSCSPAFDQSLPGSRAGTSHLPHGWFAESGTAEPLQQNHAL